MRFLVLKPVLCGTSTNSGKYYYKSLFKNGISQQGYLLCAQAEILKNATLDLSSNEKTNVIAKEILKTTTKEFNDISKWQTDQIEAVNLHLNGQNDNNLTTEAIDVNDTIMCFSNTNNNENAKSIPEDKNTLKENELNNNENFDQEEKDNKNNEDFDQVDKENKNNFEDTMNKNENNQISNYEDFNKFEIVNFKPIDWINGDDICKKSNKTCTLVHYKDSLSSKNSFANCEDEINPDTVANANDLNVVCMEKSNISATLNKLIVVGIAPGPNFINGNSACKDWDKICTLVHINDTINNKNYLTNCDTKIDPNIIESSDEFSVVCMNPSNISLKLNKFEVYVNDYMSFKNGNKLCEHSNQTCSLVHVYDNINKKNILMDCEQEINISNNLSDNSHTTVVCLGTPDYRNQIKINEQTNPFFKAIEKESNLKEGRDQTRLTDLKNIAAVLKVYYQDNKQYPTPQYGDSSLFGLGECIGNDNNDGIEVDLKNYVKGGVLPQDPDLKMLIGSGENTLCEGGNRNGKYWYRTFSKNGISDQAYLLCAQAEKWKNATLDLSSNEKTHMEAIKLLKARIGADDFNDMTKWSSDQNKAVSLHLTGENNVTAEAVNPSNTIMCLGGIN